MIEIHRVRCRRCGAKTERLDFVEGKHPYTRRFSEAVARDCEDSAVRRVALKWGLSAQTVRRIDKRALAAWSKRRRRRPLRQMGVDESFWRKGKCLTVVSDHLDGILAYCRHKVPFGVVEAINGNLRALVRRGRGYRDHEYLIPKAQKSTAQAHLAKAA